MTKPQSVHVENLESNTIRPIPLNMRHGKPGDLFTIWFGSNIMLLTVITGAMSVTIFHLSFSGPLLPCLSAAWLAVFLWHCIRRRARARRAANGAN